MVYTRVKEIEGVWTVGALREALLELPEDMAITDSLGEGLIITVLREAETGEESAEIG